MKEAVNKSNMDTEAKAEICEILTLYRDIAGLISEMGRLHRVCEKHRQTIFELAEKGRLGIDWVGNL